MDTNEIIEQLLQLASSVVRSDIVEEKKEAVLTAVDQIRIEIENGISQETIKNVIPVLADAMSCDTTTKEVIIALSSCLMGNVTQSELKIPGIESLAQLLKPLLLIKEVRKGLYAQIPPLVRMTIKDERTQEAILFILGCWFITTPDSELPLDLSFDMQLARLMITLVLYAGPTIIGAATNPFSIMSIFC